MARAFFIFVFGMLSPAQTATAKASIESPTANKKSSIKPIFHPQYDYYIHHYITNRGKWQYDIVNLRNFLRNKRQKLKMVIIIVWELK